MIRLTTEAKVVLTIAFLTILALVAGVVISSRQSQNSNPIANESELLNNVTHAIGNSSAPMRIIEFADFQCPACASAHPILQSFMEKNGEKIYFVFRHYPLPTHKNALAAAKAAEAAGLQNKFWEMHNLLFENQPEWSDVQNPTDIFTRYAEKLDLDINQFKNDLKNESLENIITTDKSLALRSAVNSTPTFFINGKKYQGVQSETELQNILNQLTSQ